MKSDGRRHRTEPVFYIILLFSPNNILLVLTPFSRGNWYWDLSASPFFVQPWRNSSQLNYVVICRVFDVIKLKPHWKCTQAGGSVSTD